MKESYTQKSYHIQCQGFRNKFFVIGIPRELGGSSFSLICYNIIGCLKTHLKTGLKDNLLPLETDVLGPLHEPGMMGVNSKSSATRPNIDEETYFIVAAS